MGTALVTLCDARCSTALYLCPTTPRAVPATHPLHSRLTQRAAQPAWALSGGGTAKEEDAPTASAPRRDAARRARCRLLLLLLPPQLQRCRMQLLGTLLHCRVAAVLAAAALAAATTLAAAAKAGHQLLCKRCSVVNAAAAQRAQLHCCADALLLQCRRHSRLRQLPVLLLCLLLWSRTSRQLHAAQRAATPPGPPGEDGRVGTPSFPWEGGRVGGWVGADKEGAPPWVGSKATCKIPINP